MTCTVKQEYTYNQLLIQSLNFISVNKLPQDILYPALIDRYPATAVDPSDKSTAFNFKFRA